VARRNLPRDRHRQRAADSPALTIPLWRTLGGLPATSPERCGSSCGWPLTSASTRQRRLGPADQSELTTQ
jgi:hypothetical protein